MEHIRTATGVWQGTWSQDRATFSGTYYFADGRSFQGNADWVTVRTRTHIAPTGQVVETVHMPIRGHWEFTGAWTRRDGKGATAPHLPEAPEDRDDGEPPQEHYDEPFILPGAPAAPVTKKAAIDGAQ